LGVNEDRIFLSPPDVGEREVEMAASAIRSGWVAPLGPSLSEFEVSIAELSRRDFAIGVSSGTAALHLSLLALGVGSGDLVLCSTLTFVATANAVAYTGAVPVFIDSLPSTGNMSPPLLREAIIDLKNQGKSIGAIVPVDFLGKVADYQMIIEIADEFEIPVVADAAESLGATRDGQPAGSFGRAAVFSFNGNKIATTSGGGMVVTDDEVISKRVRHLATQAREPGRHYEHIEMGYNYRLSNVLAAIGIAQLERLPEMIDKRRTVRSEYRALSADYPGIEIFGDPSDEDNHWLTALVMGGQSADVVHELGDFLERHNIESRPLWKPMHLQPLYRDSISYLDGTSADIFAQSLALPSGSGMTDHQLRRVLAHLRKFFERM
jgi:dTDP-4-amino-4,6-dideoxygalactose transaminase